MKKSNLIAIVVGVVMPWILTFLFLTFLTGLDWTKLGGGALQILTILSFGSIGFAYNTPIFGYGYTIPLLIWLLTGMFCGFFSKTVKRAVGITLLMLFIHILFFVLMTTLSPSYIPGTLQTAENLGLLGGFSMEFFISLGLFLFLYSLVFPGSMLGGILGGLVSRTGVEKQ